MNSKIIQEMIYNTIKKVYLIVFPPLGEEHLSEVDIRIGLVLEEKSNYLYVIGTDMEDLWSPIFSIEQIPTNHFSENLFYDRIYKWMSQELNDNVVLEYYDFTKSAHFKNIVDQKISDIEFLSIKGNPQPFGIRLLFDNDFILSLPNSDGNIIETKTFNKNEKIKNFNHLGTVIYSKV